MPSVLSTIGHAACVPGDGGAAMGLYGRMGALRARRLPGAERRRSRWKGLMVLLPLAVACVPAVRQYHWVELIHGGFVFGATNNEISAPLTQVLS